MTDSELPGDERASYDRFPTDSPFADALLAIRTLRQPPRMPTVPPGAPREEVLRVVTNVVVEFNERERHLLGAMERLAEGLLSMSAAVGERLDRIEQKIDALASAGERNTA